MKKTKRKIILALSAVVILFCSSILIGLSTMFSSAVLDEDDNSTSFKPETEVQMNALKIYERDIAEGGNPYSACAHLGVLQHESGLISSRIQTDSTYNDMWARDVTIGGYAFGLAQWDKGRRVSLINYAESLSKSWDDFDTQLDFMYSHDGTDSTLLKSILKEEDLEVTVKRLVTEWERAGVSAIDARLEYAKNWFQLIVENGVGSDLGTDIGLISDSIPSGYEDKVNPKPTNKTYGGNGYPFGQCTWGAYNRVHELGSDFPWISGTNGNGGFWYNASSGLGYTTVKGDPSVHWIACFPPSVAGADATYGHVAVVEYVNADGSILVSETNTGTPPEVRRWRVVSSSVTKHMYFINPKK